MGGKALPSVTGEGMTSLRPIQTDGFVSSASNPALAAKYGNNTASFGTAAPAQSPVTPSTNFNPNVYGAKPNMPVVEEKKAAPPAPVAPGMLPEFKPIVDYLQSIVASLEKAGMVGTESKQLSAGSEAVSILASRLDHRALSPNAAEKVKEMFANIAGNNVE